MLVLWLSSRAQLLPQHHELLHLSLLTDCWTPYFSSFQMSQAARMTTVSKPSLSALLMDFLLSHHHQRKGCGLEGKHYGCLLTLRMSHQIWHDSAQPTRMWSIVSSCWSQRTHFAGFGWPCFLNLSAMQHLLWATSHKKYLHLGGTWFFQISACGKLYLPRNRCGINWFRWVLPRVLPLPAEGVVPFLLKNVVLFLLKNNWVHSSSKVEILEIHQGSSRRPNWQLCSASASVLFRVHFGTGHMLPHGRSQLLDVCTMQPFILPEQHRLSITQMADCWSHDKVADLLGDSQTGMSRPFHGRCGYARLYHMLRNVLPYICCYHETLVLTRE